MSNFLKIFCPFLLFMSLSVSAQDKDTKNRREQIENAKISFFTSEIGLTPEESRLFWPIYNKFSEDIMQAHLNTRESYKDIKKALEENSLSDIEMKKMVIKYLDNFEREGQLQKLYMSEFFKVLSANKVAKLYVAEEAFRMTMIKKWRDESRSASSNNNKDFHNNKNMGDSPYLDFVHQ